MRKRFIAAGVLGAAFLLLIRIVRTVDVSPTGPAGTVVGLSHLNGAFFAFSGVNMLCHRISDALGILALMTAAAFGVLGAVQLIRRKSLLRVDGCILALGVLYIVILSLYVLFEKAPVNFRPVILPGESVPEPSFPSSHTVLACTVMGSAAMILRNYIKNPGLYKTLRAACTVMIAVTVFGRLFSGVHWLTDITGGAILSAALLLLYSAFAGKTSGAANRKKH